MIVTSSVLKSEPAAMKKLSVAGLGYTSNALTSSSSTPIGSMLISLLFKLSPQPLSTTRVTGYVTGTPLKGNTYVGLAAVEVSMLLNVHKYVVFGLVLVELALLKIIAVPPVPT